MSAVYTMVALAVIASGYSAYSSYQQGKSQEAWNNYNAQLEDQNAQTAARDASIQANQVRRDNARVLSRQRAAFAANGVDASTGSPLLIEANQAGYLEMGALETERQGNIASATHRQNAVLDRMKGSIAMEAGRMDATATALGGASKAAGAYAGYKGVK